MSFSKKFERLFHNILPSPFTLAVALSFAVLTVALIFFKPAGQPILNHGVNVLEYWYEGIWNGPFLVFAYQMILILVLGHVLALTETAGRLISKAASYCTNTAKAAAIVTAVCVILGLLNWGMALIFGAIFARKVAEQATTKGYRINYPLIAASGYVGLMVFHGGFSGSSLIKVAESGHLADLTRGNEALAGVQLPDFIGFTETVFSPMNLSIIVALLIILPFSAYALGKNAMPTNYHLKRFKIGKPVIDKTGWAERFDHYQFPSLLLGLLCLISASVVATHSIVAGNGNFIDPNFLNFIFLGLGLIGHGSLSKFAYAVGEAIPGAAGILIQFPLYFGIMGVMQHSGIVSGISTFFVSISNETTYPLFTFISAGLINIFVPSGGGQWMVQGPIIIESATKMGLPLGKSILAMAYGDQITNMIQPFWALPLLSITGLKAREILPYTLFFMIVGAVIFMTGLFFF